MDQDPPPNRRVAAAPSRTRPPIRLPRDRPKKRQNGSREEHVHNETGKVIVNRGLSAENQNKTRPPPVPATNYFTVANVGAGGTLYLKPSRAPPPASYVPATPPPKSQGPRVLRAAENKRESITSSSRWTLRNPPIRPTEKSNNGSVPPVSLQNRERRRKKYRSHSFSGLSDHSRSHISSSDAPITTTAKQDASHRPRSFIEPFREELDSRFAWPSIPEDGQSYIPQFATMQDGDAPKLFPAHPSNARIGSQMSHPYIHPSMAFTAAAQSIPIQYKITSPQPIRPQLYDGIEKKANDPALVRHDGRSGRIVAATIGRLIFEITSPTFLDYELLSDFFLTYRCFMSCSELLEYLFARMKWALNMPTDTGRVVRVRAFVAVRHWVLNYFADDFLPELHFRQQFCDLVNDLAQSLRRRDDKGGGDIGIIGELKKCWRRICAMFWSDTNALEASVDVNILPGGDPAIRASATSLIRQASVSGSRQRLTRIVSSAPSSSGSIADRSGCIPTSPSSEHSLQILSCSVPFLRKNVPHPTRKPQPSSTNRTPPLANLSAFHQHSKSGGSLDGLRFHRSPLVSGLNGTDDMRSITLTGGLIRGLLLQPASPKLDMLIPLTPGLESREKQLGGEDGVSYHSQTSVWKLVGGVKRALSARKGPNDAPFRGHRSNASTDSRASAVTPTNSPGPSIGKHMPTGTRVDVLGLSIETSYEDAVDDDASQMLMYEKARYEGAGAIEPDNHISTDQTFNWGRMNSHVTTGSRSIVIVDATGVPRLPAPLDGWFYDPSRTDSRVSQFQTDMSEYFPERPSLRQQQHASAPMLLGRVDQETTLEDVDSGHTAYDMNPTAFMDEYPMMIDEADLKAALQEQAQVKQLRRIPGGDLKTVDTVQDLEPQCKFKDVDSPMAYTPTGFYKQSQTPSDLSGTHFSGQDFSTWRIPLGVVPDTQDRSSWSLMETHSSQPNLRASMQSYASRLRKLPDGEYHGGIEDALLRLEGRSPVEGISPGSISQPLDNTYKTQIVSKDASPYSSGGPIDSANALAIPVNGDYERPSALPDATHLATDQLKGLGLSYNDSPAESRDSDKVATPKVVPAHSPRRNNETFLLSDTESLSDISTALGDLPEEESGAMQSLYFDDSAEAEQKFRRRVVAPATPAMTIVSPSLVAHLRAKPMDEVPTLKEAASAPKLLPSALDKKPLPRLPSEVRPRAYDAHLPFVMAFDAEVVAEQMTIIEKDALDEVDWKDLIGLIWHQTPPPVHNWVEYLKNEDSNGIDVVVARFNLVVKWIVSECILTELPSERARCIAKFIHIASHCLKLRNYASMYQITLALLSSDLARLTKTWTLVPAAERQFLAKLERLCQPVRNFHNLRVEMESSGSSRGCIPFIGLYTHDLMFNAQKTARFEPDAPATEVLVNFERYQTSATIVKSLLRLIDASGSYTFNPHPEVLSRCLWLAALDDHEIHARSLALEDGVS